MNKFFEQRGLKTVSKGKKLLAIKHPKQHKFSCAIISMWLLEDKLSSASLQKALFASEVFSFSLSLFYLLSLSPSSTAVNCYFRLLLFYFLCTNITSRANSLTRFPGNSLKTKITLTSIVQAHTSDPCGVLSPHKHLASDRQNLSSILIFSPLTLTALTTCKKNTLKRLIINFLKSHFKHFKSQCRRGKTPVTGWIVALDIDLIILFILFFCLEKLNGSSTLWHLIHKCLWV